MKIKKSLKPPPRFHGPLPFYKLYLFESSASEEYGRTSQPTDPPRIFSTEHLTPHSTSQTENGESYAPWQRHIWSYELPKLGISTFPIYFDQALVWHVLAHFAGKISFQETEGPKDLVSKRHLKCYTPAFELQSSIDKRKSDPVLRVKCCEKLP